MSDIILELDTLKKQLSTTTRRQKPKMLVVDDEPDNLDLLYRTFRRDFQVTKAESGLQALEVLEREGEVAVIISDQRMPEMKGTEFLSKTVPQFPNTVRIILTGFTDIEDLVEAINSGQVYKYITKPWDPTELKKVVQRASDTYEVLKQRTEELKRSESHMALLKSILDTAQTSKNWEEALDALAIAVGEEFCVNGCILQPTCDDRFDTVGIYSPEAPLENWLDRDPLVQEAIAQKTVRFAIDISTDANLSELPHYQNAGVRSHVAMPLVFQEKLLAILSLQWHQPVQLQEDRLELLHLVARQIALAMAAIPSQA
ncbi:response regulator [Oscillatoriales cyanobacterium LEGE 11467]|uniref:Response regulator n=1 Tax=Zarconia navalis LEGE 11467 TaxID=1828826 RepID=A0A928VW36_9CYAN|nr:response regulator [Zarconia navalis]MBE9040368.1 response regulator [Zarconia navalis LEGE 11467]